MGQEAERGLSPIPMQRVSQAGGGLGVSWDLRPHHGQWAEGPRGVGGSHQVDSWGDWASA